MRDSLQNQNLIIHLFFLYLFLKQTIPTKNHTNYFKFSLMGLSKHNPVIRLIKKIRAFYAGELKTTFTS